MDKMSVTIDSKETFAMIENLVRKVKQPEPLLTIIGRYLQAQTTKMFTGTRPDTASIRGESWPKLAESTVQKKLTLKAKGLVAGNPRRPLVEKGLLKKDLLGAKAIKVKKKGLEYGTDRRSRKNFLYPALHQTGGRNTPQRRFLFITKSELAQIATTVRDWLRGKQIKRID